MKNILISLGLMLVLISSGTMWFWQSDPFTSMNLELNTAGSIYIQWKTTADNKNARFEIERSPDRTKWTTIEQIPAQLSTQYTFLDGHPEKGINYYRIKLVCDTGLRYSKIQTIEIADEQDCYIWPQPATTVLHMRSSFSYGTLDMIDESGRIVQRGSVTGFLTDVPVSQLPVGAYFIRVKSRDKVWLKKFVKL